MESQKGFVKNKSGLTNLLAFLEFVNTFIDQGYPIDVIYFDFKKPLTRYWNIARKAITSYSASYSWAYKV